jgi:hypothetical protein
VLIGCGGSGHSQTSGSITRAKALAFAHEVNLRAGDLPGSVATSTEGEAPEPSARGKQFARCAGTTNPVEKVVDVRSPSFRLAGSRLGGKIKSNVEVMPSAQLASRTFAAGKSSRGRDCADRLLESILGQRNESPNRFTHLTISSIPSPLPGPNSFEYRIRVNVATEHLVLPVYLDAFELLSGPAEIGVTAVGVMHPPSKAIEDRAVKLVAERAASHSV